MRGAKQRRPHGAGRGTARGTASGSSGVARPPFVSGGTHAFGVRPTRGSHRTIPLPSPGKGDGHLAGTRRCSTARAGRHHRAGRRRGPIGRTRGQRPARRVAAGGTRCLHAAGPASQVRTWIGPDGYWSTRSLLCRTTAHRARQLPGCRPALVPSCPRDTSPGPVLPRGAQSTKSPTTF